MRICIVTRADLFPTNHGAAVKIVETAKSLAKLTEDTCFIATMEREFYWKIGESVEECSYSPKARAMQEWPFIRSGTRLAERICRRLGYPEEELFLYSPQFDPAWLSRLVFIGLEEDIDVFQAEFPGYGLIAELASRCIKWIRGGQKPRTSIVQHNVEWHRLQAFGHSVEWIQRMETLALQAVDDVIAVSQEDKEIMVESGIEGSKITVIPHGVSLGEMSEGSKRSEAWKKHWKLAPRPVILFFHGTLHYWPNTEAVRFIATELIPQLEHRNLDYQIVITGMNPPRYFAHEKILFTDVVEDLAGHIAMATVCICPLQAGGGTRLKLLEYMAAGKPIISTRKGAEGIPQQGQMVLAETAEDFATAIERLAGNPEQQKLLSRRALSFVSALDWDAVSGKYLYLYQGKGRGENHFLELVAPNIDIEEFLPSRTPSKPLTLLLLVNEGCNLRCSFCDLWEHHEHLSLEKMLPILDDAVDIGTKTIVLTGGEPLLHPEIFAVIRACKERGLAVNMTTNGTLVEKYWDDLTDTGIDSLSFSLDGLKQTHERIRGQVGCFDRTLSGLTRITEETSIHTSVYFVVTSENLAELWDVYILAKSLGSKFDFWPVNDAPELYLRKEQHQQWNEIIARIIADDPSFESKRSFYEDSLDYHSENWHGKVRCLGFVDQYGITYKGEFLPCCVWQGEGLVQGNVFEQTLKELWCSPEIQAYRAELTENGCDVGCFNHSLYEFEQSTGLSFQVP